MIDRFKALFQDRGGRPTTTGARHSHDELHIAAAALLFEAARMDEEIDPAERARIHELVAERFGLNEAEAASLSAAAEAEVEQSVEIWSLARVVKDGFSEAERVEMMEMLWDVAIVDGELHDHETALMRRIAGLIYVPDRLSGAARQRVLARRAGG